MDVRLVFDRGDGLLRGGLLSRGLLLVVVVVGLMLLLLLLLICLLLCLHLHLLMLMLPIVAGHDTMRRLI